MVDAADATTVAERQKEQEGTHRTYRRRWIAGKVPNRFSGINLNFYLILFLVFGVTLFGPLILGMEVEGVFPAFYDAEQAAILYLLFQKLVWPPVTLLFLLLVVGTVVFTHRIAGPLYRLRLVMRTVGEGNLSVRAAIRKRDYLQQEVDCMNEMIDSLRTKLRRVEEEYRNLQESLVALPRTVEQGSREDLTREIQRLQARMEQLGTTLHQFKTTS